MTVKFSICWPIGDEWKVSECDCQWITDNEISIKIEFKGSDAFYCYATLRIHGEKSLDITITGNINNGSSVCKSDYTNGNSY